MTEEFNKTVAKPSTASNVDVSRSASKVAIGGVFSLTAGLASQVVIAWFFGAGANMDAFLTALVIPTYLAYVLITGLSFVLIPTFVEEETKGSEDDAWSLVGTFFWLTSLILLLIAIVGSIFSSAIIEFTAPGLSPEKADLSTKMLSILMFTVPMIGLGSLAKGIQNVKHRFFWPATAPAFGSIGNVITLLVLFRVIGSMALAWGNLISAIIIASITVIPVLRHGWSKILPLSDRRLLDMIKLVIPFLVLGLFSRSTKIFERYFASGLPDGDLSYLGYASKISQILVVVLAVSIAAAIFPALARAYVNDGEDGLVEQAEYGFRLTLASALPATAILGAVAIPMVTVLYERGAFNHYDTLSVGRIVLIVMIGEVLFLMLGNVISRTFYVIKDTLTFPLISALTVGFYVIFARALTNLWGYVGLAIAQPLQMSLMILILFLLLFRKLRTIDINRLFSETLFYAIASLVAALCAWLVTQSLTFLPALLQLVIAFAVAGPVYFLILFRRDRDMAISVLEMTGLPRIVSIARNGFSHFVAPRE